MNRRKYEYDVKISTAPASKENLDSQAIEGWELVTFNLVPSEALPNTITNDSPYVWLYYFKRLVQ